MSLALRLRTLWRLGPANLARAAAYRVLLKSGYYRRRLAIAPALPGPFFIWPEQAHQPSAPAAARRPHWVRAAQRVLKGELPVFSNGWQTAGFPPRWQRSLITQVDQPATSTHWSALPDFGLAGGDVKGYWESSRFDGLLILSLGWLCSGQRPMRDGIERWLADWCAANPANAGLQWKCGQETGLRLMHTVLVADLLARWAGVNPAPALLEFVRQHADRIAPTMLYAVAQDNNHGTSEAAALYIGGLFLQRHGAGTIQQVGRRHAALGRHWLDERIGRLVMPDGSFSQHSLTYHRVMLDTLSMAETVRRAQGEPAFAATTQARARAATQWLAAFTDPHSGDGPNLGANDGARLFVLDDSAYRDFRPSLRWAAALFLDQAPAGPDERLAWLGVSMPAPTATGASPVLWPDGGYARLACGPAWALVRLPRFRFRPSHADVLHLDLWVRGMNYLRDGGSFSYNTEPRWLDYFGGTASHNTVQFDARDQMPRLSRFLFGAWPGSRNLAWDAATGELSVDYRDYRGARHHRRVQMSLGRCLVIDEVAGFDHQAVLRWRLAPSAAGGRLDGQVWQDAHLRISVSSSKPIARLACVEGWESRHYNERSPLPVLEVEVHADATLTTEITWPA